jgi:signal transduction histidine kinase
VYLNWFFLPSSTKTMNDPIFNITLLFSVLIGVIIIYFFVSIVSYHRRYVKLQKERINAEITIQENERRRIANDLHDSFGPMLAAVKINISNIVTHSEEDEAVIQKSGGYIDEIITNLRRISHNLLPNTLQRRGVVEALQEFIHNLQCKYPLPIQFNVMKNVKIPPDKGIHIFRILQEIIHNTVKHSRANKLQIDILEKKGFLLIITRDDGIGFNTDMIRTESNGLGLKSIESRVELLNGKLMLESAPKKGTVYFLEIPFLT